MEQKTMTISLQAIIKFADENGYRLKMLDKIYPNDEQNQNDINELLEYTLEYLVRCRVIGCGVDFRRSVSLDEQFEFLLMS